jgi:general secretion pathway protein G
LRRQRREEGMTLVEIMIVVIIMALIATAVGVAVLPQLQKAQDKTAKGDAQAIRSAVTLYIGENPGECPTVDDLKEGGFIDSSKRTADPWDNEFQIECNGSNISVISAGKDGQFGTEDDIQ